MSGTKELPTIVPFGPFEADLQSQELRKQGVRLRLPRQSFQILKMLLERPGELVTREELRAVSWPADTFVDFEHSLNAAVNKLREVLCDDADKPRYVETLPRRGYRFIGPLAPPPSISPSPPAASHSKVQEEGNTDHSLNFGKQKSRWLVLSGALGCVVIAAASASIRRKRKNVPPMR